MAKDIKVVSVDVWRGDYGRVILRIPEQLANEMQFNIKFNGISEIGEQEKEVLSLLANALGNPMVRPMPKNVIFHDPATIVYWNDGTKTVVKCDPRDSYSKEAGLAMCFMKKMCGSSRAFNDTLRKWTE